MIVIKIHVSSFKHINIKLDHYELTNSAYSLHSLLSKSSDLPIKFFNNSIIFCISPTRQ